MMSPSHFTDTAIGGSAAGVSQGGLTPLGREWVKPMEAKGMLIDVAHASHATLRDVTSLASKPLVVSHTGVKGTCDNNRNLSDEELRAVAATGGVIGIGCWETASCGRDADAIAAAMRYAVGEWLARAHWAGLRLRRSGHRTIRCHRHAANYRSAAAAGFSEHDIRLIMGENVARVLSQILPE